MKNLKQLLMRKKNMKENIRNIKNRDELTEKSRDKKSRNAFWITLLNRLKNQLKHL